MEHFLASLRNLFCTNAPVGIAIVIENYQTTFFSHIFLLKIAPDKYLL